MDMTTLNSILFLSLFMICSHFLSSNFVAGLRPGPGLEPMAKSLKNLNTDCNCEDDLCSSVEAHDFVIEGRIKKVNTQNNETVKYVVKVLNSFKGKVPKKLSVFSRSQDPCLQTLKKKNEYLLFLVETEDHQLWIPSSASCFTQKSKSLTRKQLNSIEKCANQDPDQEEEDDDDDLKPECGPVCAIFCAFGNVLDENGCPTCKCNEPPSCPDGSEPVNCFDQPCSMMETRCPEASRCVDDYCGGCNAHFFDKEGNEICQQQSCPEMMCDVYCEFGHVLDRQGCPTCQCVERPSCPDGSQPVECLVDPCHDQRAKCSEASRCVSDYCGGCNAKYFNREGQEICKN